MTPEWHYQKNNQEFGPITFDQLKELAAAGQLLASDLVWRQGTERRRAGIIKGFFPPPSAPAPPHPNPPPHPSAPVSPPHPPLPANPAASIWPTAGPLTRAL